MLVNLPSGKTVNMSLDEYLVADDFDLKQMVGNEQGYQINNWMTDSCLAELSKEKAEDIEEEDEYENDRGLFSNEDLNEFFENDSFGTC